MAEAGTVGRNIIQSLQTSSNFAPKQEALSALGLTPQDVDLTGETLPEVLDKLSAGLDKLPEEQRAPTLAGLFEKSNVPNENTRATRENSRTPSRPTGQAPIEKLSR